MSTTNAIYSLYIMYRFQKHEVMDKL